MQFAIHSVCCSLLFRFTSSSCILACWQVIFDDTRLGVHKKKFIIFATIRTFLFFSFLFFFSLSFIAKWENLQPQLHQRFRLSFQQSRLGPLQSSSAAPSTLAISSPIHTHSPNPFSSSQCIRPGYAHQIWCQYLPKQRRRRKTGSSSSFFFHPVWRQYPGFPQPLHIPNRRRKNYWISAGSCRSCQSSISSRAS